MLLFPHDPGRDCFSDKHFSYAGVLLADVSSVDVLLVGGLLVGVSSVDISFSLGTSYRQKGFPAITGGKPK